MKNFALFLLFFPVSLFANSEITGIDTALFSHSKTKWYYSNQIANGVKDVKYKEGPFAGRLSVRLYFNSGCLDSIISYQFGYLPLCFSQLSVLSTITYIPCQKKRVYKTYGCDSITYSIFTHKMMSNHKLNSIKAIYEMFSSEQIVAHGLYALYYSNGLLREHGQYVMGNKEGCWFYYNETTTIVEKKCYKKNVLISASSMKK